MLSFCRFTAITDVSFTGLDNYVRAFTVDNYFIHSFFFTLLNL